MELEKAQRRAAKRVMWWKNKSEGPGLQFGENKPDGGCDCSSQNHEGGCPSAFRTFMYLNPTFAELRDIL